jgi:hypothetical protein
MANMEPECNSFAGLTPDPASTLAGGVEALEIRKHADEVTALRNILPAGHIETAGDQLKPGMRQSQVSGLEEDGQIDETGLPRGVNDIVSARSLQALESPHLRHSCRACTGICFLSTYRVLLQHLSSHIPR